MDDQNKNLILATALSFLVILVWFVLFPPEPPVDPAQTTTIAAEDGSIALPPADNSAAGSLTVPGAEVQSSREVALASVERIEVETPRLVGSISLRGGRIDDLLLKDYMTSIEADAEIETLLTPAGAQDAYYALHGWGPAGNLPADQVPGASTDWTVVSGAPLSPGAPLVLEWANTMGMTFSKSITVDEDYLFTITQEVRNASGAPVRMFPYGIIARKGEPPQRNFFILHEGVVSSSDGNLGEESYDALRDLDFDQIERAHVEKTEVTENGWVGFTDHYWMTSLLAGAGQSFTSVIKYTPGNDTYQTDMRLPVVEIADGASTQSTTYFYAGAKEWAVLREYQDSLNIDQFVDSIDWGWFYFLTKPIFQALHYLNLWIGNMGWAIIGLTVIIKTLLLPLAYKSYVSMSKMKKLQPEMEKIKERAGDDRMKLQQEMMTLYKTEKVNPASGCLPILLQIPIFFSLYKVIFVTIELRHAPFFGWIRDLSAPDPSSFLNLFGLLPFTPPGPESLLGIFSIGVFPILMGVTMWMQQKLNPAPTDKTQAMIFAWMPWIFMFMLGTFASGLVVYWCANNILTFSQQYLIMRSQGVKPDVFGNILSSFKREKPAED